MISVSGILWCCVPHCKLCIYFVLPVGCVVSVVVDDVVVLGFGSDSVLEVILPLNCMLLL